MLIDNLDAVQTAYDNERAASVSIQELNKPFMDRISAAMRETVLRLFGDLPGDQIIERFDLGDVEFWHGPKRAFFEEKSADECFAWLESCIRQFPDGKAGINVEAVQHKISPVVKEAGEQGQIFLYWMWKE